MTNNIATTLQECHRIVWQYRAELEHVWPTPSTEDALLFAFTELGEAVDAHLRSKAEYARNRDKDLSVLDELADCAMMLLTALGKDYVIRITGSPLGSWPDDAHDWQYYTDDMNRVIAMVFWEEPDMYYAADWRDNALAMVDRIQSHPDMDLPARLTARLERIKAKRLPPKRVTVEELYTVMVAHAGAHE